MFERQNIPKRESALKVAAQWHHQRWAPYHLRFKGFYLINLFNTEGMKYFRICVITLSSHHWRPQGYCGTGVFRVRIMQVFMFSVLPCCGSKRQTCAGTRPAWNQMHSRYLPSAAHGTFKITKIQIDSDTRLRFHLASLGEIYITCGCMQLCACVHWLQTAPPSRLPSLESKCFRLQLWPPAVQNFQNSSRQSWESWNTKVPAL